MVDILALVMVSLGFFKVPCMMSAVGFDTEIQIHHFYFLSVCDQDCMLNGPFGVCGDKCSLCFLPFLLHQLTSQLLASRVEWKGHAQRASEDVTEVASQAAATFWC